MVAPGPIKEQFKALGLSCAATELEVKEAYLRLAREHHPDHNYGDHEAAERFKEVQVAYESLCRHFAKPKPKARPRRSDQSPFVAPDSSRYSFLRLGLLAASVPIFLIATLWGWHHWQPRLALQGVPESHPFASQDTSRVALAETSVSPQSVLKATFAAGDSDDEDTAAALSNFEESIENAGALSDHPADGVVHSSYSAIAPETNQSSTFENEIIPVRPLSHGSFSNSDEIVERDFEISDVGDSPTSPNQLMLPDRIPDLDFLDPITWYGYLEAINQTPAKSAASTNPAPNFDGGSSLGTGSSRYSTAYPSTSYQSSHGYAEEETLPFELDASPLNQQAQSTLPWQSPADLKSTLDIDSLDAFQQEKPSKPRVSNGIAEFSYDKRSSRRRADPTVEPRTKRNSTDRLRTPQAFQPRPGKISSLDDMLFGGVPSAPSHFERSPRTKMRRTAEQSLTYSSPNTKPIASENLTELMQPSLSPARKRHRMDLEAIQPSARPNMPLGTSKPSPFQPGVSQLKSAERPPKFDRIQRHKKNLQPYSSKAPSKGMNPNRSNSFQFLPAR